MMRPAVAKRAPLVTLKVSLVKRLSRAYDPRAESIARLGEGHMNRRFGTSVVAALIACVVGTTSLSVVNASAANARGGPHFTRVAAVAAGAVRVRDLLTP